MKIFRFIEGVKQEIHDIEVDDNTELNQKISGQDLIRSRFTSEGFMYDIQIGDFVEFQGIKYTILDEPQIKKAQNSFSYDLQFKSDQYLYNNVQLLNPDTTETEFFLFGDAIDMVSLVLNNMNRVYGQEGGTYYADYVEETEGRNMRFNNLNCLSALDQIAQNFGCEFIIKGYKLTFRKKIGKETGLTFRYKKELREIERKTIQGGELVTVLYPTGSERNITNEYGSKRLKIPKLTNNLDIFGTIERAVTFEDIYPRLKGVVSSVQGETVFTDTGIDFDVTQQLMSTKAKVVFNTGDLAGREYEIDRYNHTEKKFTIIPYTDESDFKTPDENFRPRVGDKYVLVNIKMPQEYITNAEEELTERAQEYLEKYSQPNVIYSVGPHYPEMRRQGLNLELGDVVQLVDEDFGIDFDTRILALTRKINDPSKYTLEIGNQVTLSYFSKVAQQQKDLRNDIYQNDRYYTEQLNRIYNNVRGITSPFLVNRGEFSPANFYYNNQNRRDYVWRIISEDGEEVKRYYIYIGEDHQRAEWIEANWQIIGDYFGILAVEDLLANNANIGGWLIQNGQIVSQAIYEDIDNPENNEPRVHLNGEEGHIRMTSGVGVANFMGVVKRLKQTMLLDSNTGKITMARPGKIGLLPSRIELSSEGFESNYPGKQVTIRDPELMRPSGAFVGDVEVDASGISPLSPDFVAAFIGKAKNTSNYSPVPAYGAAIWGLKTFGRYVNITNLNNSGTYYLKEFDEYLSCTNVNPLNIYLPSPSSAIKGRKIEVRRNNGQVAINGKLFSAEAQSKENLEPGNVWTCINDGVYWLINFKPRTD